MRKLINLIKDIYQNDKQGFFGMVAWAVMFYVLYWFVLPIIMGV